MVGSPAGAGGEAAGQGGTAGESEGGAAAQAPGGAAGDASLGGAAGAGGSADSGPIVTVPEDCLPPPVATITATAVGFPAAGLKLWLRGDHGVWATAEHRVCAWVDLSGNDNVLYATGQNRPLWGDEQLSSLPAIDFDTTTNYLSTGGVLDIAPTSGRTFIAVVQMVNTTGRFAAVMQGESGTPGTYVNLDTNTFLTQGSREGVYVTNNAYDAELATSTSPRVHLFTVSTMVPATPVLNAIEYRVNGAVQTLTRTQGGLGNGNIEDFSGAGFTLVGSGTHASIAEVLVYDRALSSEEKSAVEAVLKARYTID